MILIMNFFRTIPKALEEAARIDGASFFTVFRKIYLPLSKAGLATVGLFIMVGNWNEWFTGILYKSRAGKPRNFLQLSDNDVEFCRNVVQATARFVLVSLCIV